jgi:hypothetical protein
MYDMSNLKKLNTLGQLAPAAWQRSSRRLTTIPLCGTPIKVNCATAYNKAIL